MIAAAGRAPWLLLALLMTALVAALGGKLAGIEANAALLLFLRSFLALALVLPWCVAAAEPRASYPFLAVAGALGLAIVPCWIYVNVVTASRAGEAATLLQQQRLAKAEPVIIGLCELGSNRRVGTMTTFEARRWLTATLPTLRRQSDQPLPVAATPSMRMDRAVVLVKVERLDDAAELIRPLVPADDKATAMLAAIYRDQERWADSD